MIELDLKIDLTQHIFDLYAKKSKLIFTIAKNFEHIWINYADDTSICKNYMRNAFDIISATMHFAEPNVTPENIFDYFICDPYMSIFTNIYAIDKACKLMSKYRDNLNRTTKIVIDTIYKELCYSEAAKTLANLNLHFATISCLEELKIRFDLLGI